VEGERGKKKDEEGGGWKRIRERINRISPLLFLLLHKDIEKKENDDDEEEDTERMSSLSFSTYHSLMDTGLQRILKTVKKTTSTGRKSRTLLKDWWSFRRN